MLKLAQLLSAALLGVALAGCRDNTPPVQRVAPPELGRDTYHRDVDYAKPLPKPGDDSSANAGPAPFADQPLLVDQPPEAKAFVDTYRTVGRPHIVVFVNRTLEGQITPATGANRTTEGTQGSGTYLKHGQYDEIHAKAIDYGMMETLLADWLSCDNQVTIISPTLAHKKLTDEQIRDLQDGKSAALADVYRQLDADVLIQVQARPTKQGPLGLDLRIIAEAMNVRGGESLARAAVDLPPPLDKPQLNTYTRFLARKLMDGMTQTWNQPRPEAAKQPAPPAAETPKQP